MKVIKRFFYVSLTLILFASCKNYYIPIENLKGQFANIDSTKLKQVLVRGPIGEHYKYLANPIDSIECFDKNGNPFRLKNSPSIEMRVTGTNGKRTIIYFDRTLIIKSKLYGIRSRFIPSIDTKIELDNIKKIEIQDGKKNFKYVEE